MKSPYRFSVQRWLGIVIKEFVQLKRDRLALGMILGIPLMQLLLFGFAVNTDPRHLPTAVVINDPGPQARAFVAALKNSSYFDVIGSLDNEGQAERLLNEARIQFVVTIPANFHRDLLRGEHPQLLVEADATDPLATYGAVAVLNALANSATTWQLPHAMKTGNNPVDLRIQRRYNPEGVTTYNVVPGLLGVVLTLTMVLMSGLAITRERERGTLENLLSTPATPLEVIMGKLMPYLGIGFIQVALILSAAKWIFNVPMVGSLLLLYAVVLIFISANLVLGITLSSVARNQLQTMQMSIFFFLPSLFLSGFMFPFRGMPEWAQMIGNFLPLTHFLILVRGILLKGNGLDLLWSHIWPLLAFIAVVLSIGIKTFRRTLD